MADDLHSKSVNHRNSHMKSVISVLLQKLPHAQELAIPEYATAQSAGVDLRAAVGQSVVLGPMQRELIPTGFAIALPHGFEAQIRPRSGLALKHGVTVLNSPGTIDADYRGEIQILLINLGKEAFTIHRGERIAQMVIMPVVQAEFSLAEALPQTQRGAGGFGSTGVG